MAKATKKDKEVTLETVLWNCRVALRGVGSTEKNRDAVIGLAFQSKNSTVIFPCFWRSIHFTMR